MGVRKTNLAQSKEEFANTQSWSRTVADASGGNEVLVNGSDHRPSGHVMN